MKTSLLWVSVVVGAVGIGGCSDDGDVAAPPTPGAGGAATVTSSTATSGQGGAGNGASSATSGAGGEGGGGMGGAGGTGGAGGGEGFPWEGAIDPNGGPSSSRLTARPLGSTDANQGFYEYLPPGYPGAVGWPLLVALHGLGENGNGTTDLGKVLATGIPKLIDDDAWPGDRPFVVVMPQHSAPPDCPTAGEIEAMLDFAIAEYAIDPRYVYLTGLSCGAIGSWGYLRQHLDSQIAAMVPIAGNGTYAWDTTGCDLAKVGIWAFHGEEDTVVYPGGTNYVMDNLATCPSPPAKETKKTLYPGVAHGSWNMTYDGSAGHDIYTWMLGFTKTP